MESQSPKRETTPKAKTVLVENEKKPTPEWEDPQSIVKQAHIYKQTLKQQGLSEEDIEAELKEWRGEINT
jgi:hypothetical protein